MKSEEDLKLTDVGRGWGLGGWGSGQRFRGISAGSEGVRGD